jgi:hypothetical protein
MSSNEELLKLLVIFQIKANLTEQSAALAWVKRKPLAIKK